MGAAAAPGARLLPCPVSLPAPHGERGLGQCVQVGGIGKAPHRLFLFLLCSPGLLSGALFRPPGTWLRPPRPSVAPYCPRPGLGSLRLPACQEAPGVPRLWAARSWGDGVGMWGEAPLKFSELRAGVGVRLRVSGGVCLGGTLRSLSFWATIGRKPYLEAVVGGGKHLSFLLFLQLVCRVRGAFGGLCTHHDGDAIADGGEWFVFISPRCLLFVGTSCWPY